MTRSLVTGGAGFIGSTLVDRLLREGHEVSILDDLSTGKQEYVNSQAGFYNLDIRSEQIAPVFEQEQFDYVLHLAAQIDVRISVDKPQIDNDINVFGGLNVLDNAYRNGVKKFIFVSTGGAVYGDVEDIPTTEDVIPRPISPYGIHKLTFEKYLNYYHKVYGLDYISLRPANIYGPRQYKGGETGVISVFIDKAVQKEQCIINGDGEQTRDFVYVDDLVDAFLKARVSDHVGEINIGTGRETSVLDVVKAIEKATGEVLNKKHGPALPGEQKRSCLSYDRAQKILGWQPRTDLYQGVAQTLQWSRSLKNG